MEELEKLRKLILKLSYREGEFTLASGQRSAFYFDLKQTTLNPEGLFLISKLFCERLPESIEVVGGLSVGADPLVTGCSFYAYLYGRKLYSFYVRKKVKDHGTSTSLEGLQNLHAGQKVYILEDVVTSGQSAMLAVQEARKYGLEAKGVLAIVDRQEGGAGTFKKEGLNFNVLFTKDQIAHGL
ncbi:MAG: orotate phosphoribosyltransferase [Deltaproteobacteria bacterium]|nr:orotate phosphoribosyltransferase [Deltaproteobacteria bacterium]